MRGQTLTPIGRPANTVDWWEQPDSEGVFGQYGYCGATAARTFFAGTAT
jgi:hypothetical protein